MSDERWKVLEGTRETLNSTVELLKSVSLSPQVWDEEQFRIHIVG